MAGTVNAAFSQFLTESVNLDPDVSSRARSSRDWLLDQLNDLDASDQDVPFAYSKRHVFYGSFARRTKIRPLDDVDLLFCMSAEGAVYQDFGDQIVIVTPDDSRLSAFRHSGNDLLNSRLIINQYVRSLSAIPQYSKADVHRNLEAVVLNLTSYPWSFDIIPSSHRIHDEPGGNMIAEGKTHIAQPPESLYVEGANDLAIPVPPGAMR